MLQPLAILFVWNIEDSIAESVVNYSTDLLSKSKDKPFSRNIDIPIFHYKGSNTKVPPLVKVRAEKVIIYPFIGVNAVGNSKWIEYIEHLYSIDCAQVVIVALDKYAFNIGKYAKPYNYIRLFDYETLVEEKVFICLAHEIYRYGFNQNLKIYGDEKDSALKIFISHAKDGKIGINIAKKLKNYLDYSDVKTFFDACDIPPGYAFNDVIIKNISEASIVLINSDIYSSRYWCQREIHTAKIMDRPIIEVDALDSDMDRKFPFATNYPVVRVNVKDGIDEIEILRILTSILIETIRFYYSQIKLKLFVNEKHYSGMKLRKCYRPPELADVEKIIGYNAETNNVEREYEVILYPDPPVYSEEIEYLKKLNIEVITPLTSMKYSYDKLKVGISISTPVEENIEQIGQDKSYLVKLSQELAKYLLGYRATLIYGGDLRPGGFTETIFLEAKIVMDRLKREEVCLKNYLAWPIYRKDSSELTKWRAEYNNLAQMINVEIDESIRQYVKKDAFIEPVTVENWFIWAKCLTHMRNEMIKDCNARICAGGKFSGYSGKMPGVLEEILISVRLKCPIYLLGGFGGAVQEVTQIITKEKEPEFLTMEWQKENNKNYEQLLDRYKDNGEIIQYEKILEEIKTADLNNGLDDEENFRLFKTVYIDEAMELIFKGLSKIKNQKKEGTRYDT